MADFIINAGIRFDPKDIDTSAIVKAIASAAANAQITLNKVSLGGSIKDQIQGALSDIRIRLSDKNVDVGISSKVGKEIATTIQQSVAANPLKLTIDGAYLRNQIDSVIKGFGAINLQIGAGRRAAGGGKAATGGGAGGGIPGLPAGGGGGAGGGGDIDAYIAKREKMIAFQLEVEARRLLKGEAELTAMQRINEAKKRQEADAMLGVTQESKYLERIKKATDLQNLIDIEKEAELKLQKSINAQLIRQALEAKKQALGMGPAAGPTPADLMATKTAKTAGMAGVAITPAEIDAKVAAAIRAATVKEEVAARLPQKAAKPLPEAVSPGDALRKQTSDMEALIVQTTAAERATNSFNKLLLQGAGNAETFGAKIGQITTRFAAYLVSLKAIFAVQTAFSESLKFIFKFDNALQEVQKILQLTPTNLGKVSSGLFDVANATGKSVAAVTESFNGFIRSGLGVEEALKRTQAAMVAMNATGLTVEESTQLITSAMTIYGKEMKNEVDAADKLTVADTMAAASAGEIARAFLRSGGAAEAIGVSYQELTAIIAGTIEATQLSGSTIGAALKTIFANLASNAEKLRETANAWGANIQAGEDLYIVLQKLAAIYPTLNKEQVAQINQVIAGKRRFTELSGLLGNFGKIQAIVAAESNSAGAAAKRNETDLQKLDTQVQLVKNSFSEFVAVLSGVGEGGANIGSVRDVLSDMLGIVASVGTALTEIVKGIQEFKLGVFGAGSILTTLAKAAFFTYGLQAVRSIVSGFKTFMSVAMGVGQSLSSVARIQGQMPQQIEAVATAEGHVLTIEQKRLATLIQMKQITGQIASKSGQSIAMGGKDSPMNQVKGFWANTSQAVSSVLNKPFVQIGIAAAVQVASDGLREFAQELREKGDYAGARFEEASAKALDLGVTVSMIAGPLAGLAATMLSWSYNQIASTIRITAAETAQAKALESVSARTISFGEAIATGGDIGAQAFQELAGSTANLNTAIVGFAAFLERMASIEGESINSIAKLAVESSDLADKMRQTVAGAERATDIRKEMERAAEEFRKKASDIQLQIGLKGSVLPEFADVRSKIVDASTAMEKMVYRGAEVAGVWTKAHSATQLVAESQKQLTAKSYDLVTQYGFSNAKIEEQNKLIKVSQTEVDGLRKRSADRTKELENQIEAIEYEIKGLDRVIDRHAQLAKVGDETKQTERLSNDAAAEKKRLEERITMYKKAQEQVEKNLNEAGAQLNELTAQREKLSKELIDDAVKEKIAVEGIAQAAKLIPEQLALNKKLQQEQMAVLTTELSDRLAIADAVLKGGSLAERAAAKELAARQAITRQVKEFEAQQSNTISALEQEQKKAIDNGRTEQATSIATTIAKMKAMGPVLAEALKQKLELELNIKKVEVYQENIIQAENALRDVRIKDIQAAVDAEQRAASRRLDLIKKFAETSAGRKFLDKEFRPSQYAERNFGMVGAIMIEEFNKSAQIAVGGVVAELELMRINGSQSLQDLRKAMDDVSQAEDNLAELRRKGADAAKIKAAETELVGARDNLSKMKEGAKDAFEQMQKSQEIMSLAMTKNEELKAQIQEQVLAKVQSAIDKVNAAEEKLIEIRNKLPAANAKIIESQRAVGDAQKGVDDATSELMKAYQNLADAQYKLNSDIALAEFKARQAVGAFHGFGSEIAFLRGKWSELQSTVKASTQAQLELRRQIAQEEMAILQRQFDATKSLAMRAATSGPEELFKMQQQIAAGQAIAAGRISPNEIDPELLSGLEGLSNVIPGLEKALTKFGLEQLGLPTNTLDQMGQNIIGLSQVTAEGGKAQVDQAAEQVKAAQENLMKAEEQKQVALQNLQVSVEQRDAIIASAAIQQAAVGIAQSQLSEQQFYASQQLKKLEEEVWASEELRALYERALSVHTETKNELITFREASLRALTDLKATVAAMTTSIAASAAGGGTTTAARGTLTSSEFMSVLSAARHEKSAMPPGSHLMMANTSETVLTRRQSKMLGLTPQPVTHAQGGNAAIDPNVISEAVANGVKQAVGATLPTQNIVIQLDQAKRIQVQGLEGIDSAMRQAFEERSRSFADADEQKVISDIVQSIVSKLNENGLTTSQGS